jgi:Protein of unknown function (DUF3592)
MSMQMLVLTILASETALLVGIMGVGIFLAARNVWASKSWPSVTGQVLTSQIQYRRGSRNRGRTAYPCILYAYQVDGQVLQSTRIYFGSEVGGIGAQYKCDQYPAGSAVEVFFDPDNPQSAVLERRAPATFWLLLVITIVLVANAFAASMVLKAGGMLARIPVF